LHLTVPHRHRALPDKTLAGRGRSNYKRTTFK
jgi:hypothetical protein